MKLTIVFGLIILVAVLYAFYKKPKEKTDMEFFEEILNDPRVNSREVGEREGIKYFQYVENGKTGFRDLDGKIVIKAIYESAEMFSEGYSAVEINGRWGLIDENGNYIIEPQFEYLGSVHNGLASFRFNDKYGFVDITGQVKIKPQFDWVDEFAEGFCVVRNDKGKLGSSKNGYIDTSGKMELDFKFKYAGKFENGKAKVKIDKDFVYIDKKGKVVLDTTEMK